MDPSPEIPLDAIVIQDILKDGSEEPPLPPPLIPPIIIPTPTSPAQPKPKPKKKMQADQVISCNLDVCLPRGARRQCQKKKIKEQEMIHHTTEDDEVSLIDEMDDFEPKPARRKGRGKKHQQQQQEENKEERKPRRKKTKKGTIEEEKEKKKKRTRKKAETKNAEPPKPWFPHRRRFYNELAPHVNHLGKPSYRVIKLLGANAANNEMVEALTTPSNVGLCTLAKQVLRLSLELTLNRKDAIHNSKENQGNIHFRPSSVQGTVPVSCKMKPTDTPVAAHCLVTIYEHPYMCVRLKCESCIYVTIYYLEDVIRWRLFPLEHTIWEQPLKLYDEVPWSEYEH